MWFLSFWASTGSSHIYVETMFHVKFTGKEKYSIYLLSYYVHDVCKEVSQHEILWWIHHILKQDKSISL